MIDCFYNGKQKIYNTAAFSSYTVETFNEQTAAVFVWFHDMFFAIITLF